MRSEHSFVSQHSWETERERIEPPSPWDLERSGCAGYWAAHHCMHAIPVAVMTACMPYLFVHAECERDFGTGGRRLKNTRTHTLWYRREEAQEHRRQTSSPSSSPIPTPGSECCAVSVARVLFKLALPIRSVVHVPCVCHSVCHSVCGEGGPGGEG